ncbi:MAG: hypothetical protein R3F49_23690 [Planctomycetota bacterium]
MLTLLTSNKARNVAATVAAGAVALGICVGLAAAGAGDDPRGGSTNNDFSSDPTVGTLPMRTGGVDDVPGPDQVIYLYGEASALRAALDAVTVGWTEGQTACGVWELPEGRAWVEFHGDIVLQWSDARVLDAVEVGIGAGFEGGGMLCAVESSVGMTVPSLLEVGRSFALSPERMMDAGLLQRPVILHGLHHSGDRTEVIIEAPAGGLALRQTL